MFLEFRVNLLAVGKQEGATTRTRKDGRRYPYIYTKPTSRRFMADVKAAAELAVRQDGGKCWPTDDALSVDIIFFLPRGKSIPKGRRFPICKPDCTNVQKAVEDALHKVVFKNDSHVVDIATHKRYCADGDEPHILVTVWTAGTRKLVF